ncbi:MAG: type II toxin-antitoxin system Phd/YefM family antitoxin [Candidatus Acidiferrum sp.]|jgi:antitoxin Phd
MAWQLQQAKARFSEFLNQTLKKGPQVVTRRGVETAVLVSIDEWRRLNGSAKPSLKDLLLADQPRFDMPLPRRGKRRSRKPVKFD